MKKVVFLLMMMTVLLSSCGEYNKILKSTDYELKYSYAKKYFNAKQYSKSATLLDELVTIFKGTAYAEESLYLLAQSYYGQKDYQTASQYFETYYTTYPGFCIAKRRNGLRITLMVLSIWYLNIYGKRRANRFPLIFS